jgi:methylphosphotriester-DNA--protein-cysteine methyltransferase
MTLHFTGSEKTLTPAQTGAGLACRSEPADLDLLPQKRSTGRADQSAAGAPSFHHAKTAGGADRPPSPAGAVNTSTSPALVRAVNLIRDGLAVSAAAQRCGLSVSYIHNAIALKGVTLCQLPSLPAWQVVDKIVRKGALRLTEEARRQRITLLQDCLSAGMSIRAAARVMGFSENLIYAMKDDVAPELWPKRSRSSGMDSVREAGFLNRIAADVAAGSDVRNLCNRYRINADGLTALLTRHDRLALMAQIEANSAAQQLTRDAQRLGPLVEKLEDLFRKGRGLTEARRAFPVKAAKFRAALALVAPDLVNLARASDAIYPPRPPRVPRPPLHAPLPAHVILPVPAPPPVPKAAGAPRSAFDVTGPEAVTLAATKGRSAALAAWSKDHSMTLAQALARWHRLPPALKDQS